MGKYRKLLITILTIVAILCLLVAGFMGIRQALQDKQNEDYLDALRETAEMMASSEDSVAADGTETFDATENADASDTETTEKETATPEATDTRAESTVTDEADANDTATEDSRQVENYINPYVEAFASNEDIVAWLQIPDTNVDYPVVWTPEDENYYLYRDIQGNEDKNGCLLLDTDSAVSPLTTNLIIHGHNMRSGAMFGKLTDYENFDFYENHKYMTLYTEECQRNYEVIAVFRSQVYKKSDTVFKFYKFFRADTQEEFDNFYHNIKDLSLYDTGVTAQFGDHFLTLSTCVYHVEQGRFVVVAKELTSED